MIQRLQSVYLFIVAIISVVSLFSTIARYLVSGQIIATFTNFSFSATQVPFHNIHSAGPWALGIILIIVATLSIGTIFMFNHRIQQIRVATFSTILLFGYVATYAFFAWVFGGKLNELTTDISFQLPLAAFYPVICIILNCMAIHRIRKDEKLVRSLDRIR